MTPSQFEKENEPRWQRLQQLLREVESNPKTAGVEEIPQLFRQACHDLSVAQHRMYGPRLVGRLNALAITGYRTLERRISGGWERLAQMIFKEFPQAVRGERGLFWFCMVMFWGPFLFLAAWTPFDPEWAMSILGPDGMIQMEMMYGKGTSPHDYMREEFGSNFGMFAFYIWNNVGIDLRTFAGGLLGGVGSIIIMLFNGAHLGAAVGYVHHACNPETFYAFVAGHSAPELMGVVISGMAGMRLGLSLVKPGPYDRKTALVLGGRRALILIAGAALMTAFAAVIEGFWSANPFPPFVRYAVGMLLWVVTLGYLFLSGRERPHAP
ncbi:stage II sporulation protein M [Prosthecobacter dejongeii]|uniref:Putative membrane protein SpoIIM required for sporulation n=1 Tax=Prosthecobacter dejongeii TaxID=48465 RepID=A0A7W8DRH5_9BACT|nr:stage II sporulation protein M [Prosthecobacter dejongeii]MBB5039452.1 putative membrane protein SpoIIM required for sporulation [Prosthecobacter dejongeii]